ncbi:MAG: OmpA family protein [Bacteroidota bacterium]
MKKIVILIAIFLVQSQGFTQAREQIKSIFFGGGSYYIDQQQAQELQQFIQSLPNIEHYQISISSHTDNVGGVEYNQWLSEMRSEATIQQLSLNNIPRERVGRIDNGQLNPLYDNNTWKGRMANRRVDIIFTPLFL